jgi:hypothetical protein
MKTTFRATRIAFFLGLFVAAFLTGMAAHAQLPAFPAIPVNPDTVPDNDADWFRAFVEYQYTYDNNLFRLPSSPQNYPTGEEVPKDTSLQDHINTGSVGFDGHWLVGRQSVDYDFELDENRFARNEDLNNTAGNGKAVWNWSVASDLFGQVGGIYSRTLAGFADTFSFQRDVIDRQEYFANGRYQIGPRWAVYGGIDDSYTKNEAFVDRFNDLDLESGKAGIEFATSQQNTVGWEYRFTHGHYPQPEATLNGVSYDPDYDENSSVLLFKYALTDKTVFNGDGGYLRRSYPDNSQIGAFSGLIWHLKGLWQATDKTSLSVTASRDLQAYLYAQSDYFVQTGVAVSPVWVQSDKLTWVLVASWYKQDYLGSSPSTILYTSRRDTVSAQQGGLQYTATRSLVFTFTYRHELRNSNQLTLGYDDDIANAGVKFKF